MKRIMFLLLVGSLLGYQMIPHIVKALSPCQCRVNCGYSCMYFPGIGDMECEQIYPKAERSSTGQGIESTSQCGHAIVGLECFYSTSYVCGGSAYTTNECDP